MEKSKPLKVVPLKFKKRVSDIPEEESENDFENEIFNDSDKLDNEGVNTPQITFENVDGDSSNKGRNNFL